MGVSQLPRAVVVFIVASALAVAGVGGTAVATSAMGPWASNVELVSLDASGHQFSGQSLTRSSQAFSSDARKLVFSSTDGQVRVRDLVSGNVSVASSTAGGVPSNGAQAVASFSPTADAVAFCSHQGGFISNLTGSTRPQIVVKDLSGGGLTVLPLSGRISSNAGVGCVDIAAPVWSPNGESIAYWANTALPSGGAAQSLKVVSSSDGSLISEVTIPAADSACASSSAGFRDNALSVSADGSKVAFVSRSPLVVPDDTNGYCDVFTLDVGSGSVERVSTSAAGSQANGFSQSPTFAPTGDELAFESIASNLVPGDTNSDLPDIFVKDLDSGEIQLVSTTADGVQPSGPTGYWGYGAWDPTWSPSGRLIAFHSYAHNLASVDYNSGHDVFIKDLETGILTPLLPSGAGYTSTALFRSETQVLFHSEFSVVPGDTNGQLDLFVASAPRPADATGPVVSGLAAPVANGVGWNSTPVTVSWSARDDVDGDLTAPPPVAVVEGADQMVSSAQVCDAAGNCSTGSFGPVNVDLTAPSINPTVSGTQNDNEWRNVKPTVSFECADALSGVEACPDSVEVGEGADQSVSRSVSDHAGNIGSATVSGLNVDLTRPTLTGQPTGDAPSSGWFRDDVPVSWTCADALSGIPSGGCPADSVITGEGSGLTASGLVVDRAGNATTVQSAPVNIDRTTPTTSVSAPQGWNKSTVTLTLDPVDTLSGVQSTSWTLDEGDPTSGSTVTVTGQGRHVLRFHSVDKAGNVEDPVEVVVLIDASGPGLVHAVDPQPNDQGWNRSPVTISWTCDDPDSGVRSCPDPVTVSDEGAGQVITGEGVDNTGNRTLDQVTVNVDRTAPSIRVALGAEANQAGWYNTPVPVQWICTDALSGVADCSEPLVLTESSPGPVTGTASDVAGNTATESQPALRIDTTAPVVTINGPDNGGTYTLGSAPAATCTGSDALSGVDGDCQVEVTGGNANNVGAYTVTATASDKAGNTTMVSATYHVRYAWAGFDQPINDTAHQVNQTVSVFKAGSTVPAKFTLLGPDGQPITPVSAPQWTAPTKGVATTLPVDETVYTDAPDTGVSYSQAGEHWQYNWKTDKTQSGYYWRIGVRLDDGATHYVNIALR